MDLEAFQQPEGALIEKARAAMRPKLSGNKAARAIGLSPTRWHQIVRGFQWVNGTPVAVSGPAATVADMARVVGLAPADLEAAGRPDAAEALRQMLADDPAASCDLASVLAGIRDQLDGVVRELSRTPTRYPSVQVNKPDSGQ